MQIFYVINKMFVINNYMIQYWTSWNFMWYLGAQNGFFPVNNALKLSILTTSVLGGFMVYIYPRKMIIRGKDSNYKIPYPMLLIADLVFHQLPLLHILHTKKYRRYMCIKSIITYFLLDNL